MKKIMFNDRYGLTEAVLDGIKTQTRRVIPQATIDKIMEVQALYYEATLDKLEGLELFEYYFYWHIDSDKKFPYNIGDVVAVAQSYRDCGGRTKHGESKWEIIAKAVGVSNNGWYNKMFVRADLMPHQIRITDVRVERLQDISDEDCLKEGVVKDTCKTYFNGYTVKFSLDQYNNILSSEWFRTPREAFAHLINKVSRKNVWNQNPYVFVYDFELVK